MMTSTPEIQLLATAEAENADLTTHLTRLVNEVYQVAEDGLWVDGTTRTTEAEVTQFIRAGEIAVARLDGRIVGCVRIQNLDADTAEFGQLAADAGHREVGIGRELVRFAEQLGRNRGRSRIQLEVLMPSEWSHPSKEFLIGWYGRIGYVLIGKGSIIESYPALAPLLATTCNFMIYQKEL